MYEFHYVLVTAQVLIEVQYKCLQGANRRDSMITVFEKTGIFKVPAVMQVTNLFFLSQHSKLQQIRIEIEVTSNAMLLMHIIELQYIQSLMCLLIHLPYFQWSLW